jgi:hypothetical protein
MAHLYMSLPSKKYASKTALISAFTTWVFLTAVVSTTAHAQSAIAARITQPINESSLVTLKGNTYPLARAKYDQGAAPASLPAKRMLLVLKRSAQQDAALKTFLTGLQTPGSPSYHKFITPEQFGALYGPADADIQAVTTWLQGHGFTVNQVHKGKTAIEFSGNVAELQSAFHTSIHSYLVNGQQHYANASDPRIPAALAPVVAGLAHMNNFKPKSTAIHGPRGQYDPVTKHFTPLLTGVIDGQDFLAVGPSDAATIYDSPISGLNKNFSGTAYNGAGVTIGIANDANVNPASISTYRSFFGLPASAPNIIVDGDDPGVGDIYDSDSGEATLDVELAGAMAPGATINLYTAADNNLEYGLNLAIYRALDDNAVNILSVSFGECEAFQGTTGNEDISDEWEQAAAQGITVTVSTGDSGSAGCDDPNSEGAAVNGLAVNGLASTPYNVAVGGTDFDALVTSFGTYVGTSNTTPYYGTALNYIPENPWNNSTTVNTSLASNVPYSDQGYTNIIGAGGGQSNCAESTTDDFGDIECLGAYPKPSWQQIFDNGDGVRDVPDISLFASNGFYNAAWAICAVGTEGGTAVDDCQVSNTGAISSISLFGGTSTSTPAMAGILALVSQKVGGRLGQADQVLYPLAHQTPAVFHDVTVGNNSVYCVSGSNDCGTNQFLTGYNAGTSYDLASGLGSVDVKALVNDWSTVTFAASTTSLTLNGGAAPISIAHGANVTVGVTVAGTGGTPTGDVAIVDSLNPATSPNNASITAFTLSGGTGSFTANYLPGGTYNVTAHYGGDGTFAQSTSNPVAVTVTPENSTTAPAVYSYDPTTGNQVSGSSFPYGFYTSVDAGPAGVAGGSSGDGIATGTVTFSGSLSKTEKINSEGFAEVGAYTLSPAAATVTAAYSGDASFNASSGSVAFTIVPGPTTTTTAADSSSVTPTGTLGLSVSITTDSIGTPPTGTVTFKVGTTTLGTAPLFGAVSNTTGLDVATAGGSFAGSLLTAGANSIIATYSGDSNYAGSVAPAVSVTLISTPTFTLSGTNLTFEPGATTGNTSTITVTPLNGYTGQVNLKCSVVPLSGGQFPPGCTISPNVGIIGAGSDVGVLTINSTAPTSGALNMPANSPFNRPGHHDFGWYTAGGTALAFVVFFGIPARRRGWKGMLGLMVFAVLASFAAGCGGGSSSSSGGSTGTTAGTYTVTVTGVDSITATETATTTVTVTIQ